jgi:hypothetical protein
MTSSGTSRLVTAFSALVIVAVGWTGVARADDHPGAAATVERIVVQFEGRIYELDYRAYAEPWVVDHAATDGRLDSPYRTMLAFYHTLATMQDYGESVALTRQHDGAPGEVYGDPAEQLAAAHEILSGKVLIYGEIVYGDNHIFIYRYEKSIPRNLGLAIRKFGDAYYVVQDLVNVDPLIRRLSALRWDVERLSREHPAP